MLASLNYGSRKDIKKMAKNGEIKVNEEVVKKADVHVNPEKDEIFVNGEKVFYREFVYIIMNKPQGVISATYDNYQETVIDLLDEAYLCFDLFPVGRLDKDTEGLLLLTNDGKLSHDLLSPKKHVDKIYYVEVDGMLGKEDIKFLKDGVVIDEEYKCLPAELEIIESEETSSAYITIREGKFHQVKKMMLALDCEVTYLKRIQMGNLKLDEDLELGEYRELSQEELDLLCSK